MVRATSPPLPLRLSLAAAAAAAALAGLTLVSAETKIGYTSYANIWFEPEQVINNDWFGQQEWALWTAEQWTAHLNAGAPWSVVDKQLLPASKSVHDYYSLSVYWWPNCTNVDNSTALTEQEISDQCNYYQRDGIFNPDTSLVQDHKSFDDMTDYVYLASLAYIGTGNASYATQVNSAVKRWFLDEETHMTPHLNYSQVRRGPGSEAGAKSGVLDGKGLTKLVAAVEVLRANKTAEWEVETDQGLMRWARNMTEWLITSDQGQGERAAANNHGTFYFNQLCALYILLSDPSSAASQLEWFYSNTFQGQISASGDQPLESARTRPYHYMAYNLAALITNAQLADRVGLSPPGWNRTTSSGATIRTALDYAMSLDPASTGEKDALSELSPSVAFIASKFGDPDGKYAAFLKKADGNYPGQPYYLLSQGVSNSGIESSDNGRNDYGAAGQVRVSGVVLGLALVGALGMTI